MKTIARSIAAVLIFAALSCGVCAGQSTTGWTVYNGGPDGDHYSQLKQINRANVQQLKVAWSFDKGMKNTGVENYGGPIVTAGGVVFIGATIYDHKFRAFDSRDGKLLWETELPFSGVATPSTYMIDGRQYVVIAASSARDPKAPQGGAYFAFALPK